MTLFRDFAEEWLTEYAPQKKVGTERIRKNELSHLFKHFGDKKLKVITSKDYDKMLLSLHRDEYAENTISGVHSTARMIFKQGAKVS